MDSYMRPSQRRRFEPEPPSSTQRLINGAVRLAWIAVLAWLSVQCYTKLLRPYDVHWTATRDQYQASLALMTNPNSLCYGQDQAKLRLRVELKGHYDDCDVAARVVNSWPAWTAFGRLMDDFDFCPGGTCMQFHFDTLSSLGLLFMLLAATLALAVVCIIGAFCRNAYHSIAGKHDLPLFSVPRIGAPKPYPPTQTRAYDFNAPMRHTKAE